MRVQPAIQLKMGSAAPTAAPGTDSDRWSADGSGSVGFLARQCYRNEKDGAATEVLCGASTAIWLHTPLPQVAVPPPAATLTDGPCRAGLGRKAAGATASMANSVPCSTQTPTQPTASSGVTPGIR